MHLKDAPSLITRSLRSAELAVTETRDDDPVPGLSGSIALEDAYLVSLKLRDYPDCECWERGRCVIKTDIRAGTTYLYDLKRDPRFVIDKPFHSLYFYLPRSALDGIAEQSGAPRVGELAYQPGVGHDDAVVRHIGASLLEALRRPAETNQLFVDHMMLALTAHVAQTYGGLQSRRRTGPRRSCAMAGEARLRKARSPISAESFRWNRSRPSSASRSAIFRAHFESPPACRRTNGCFASA